MRTVVIGDVHGMDELLQDILRQLRAVAETGDRLVFLGDLIDRGLGSRKVIDLVISQRCEWPGQVILVRGNHEQALLEMLAGRVTFDNWLDLMDAEPTVKSFTALGTQESFRQRISAEQRDLIEKSCLWWEDENGIYVHGGLLPGHPRHTPASIMLWGEAGFQASDHSWGKLVIYGHTPQSQNGVDSWAPRRFLPRVTATKIGLDTGAGFRNGYLSALLLPERRLFRAG